MTVEQLVPGVVGAFVGAFGWLVVGLFIQRQQFARQARNAARAVYFEVDANARHMEFALEHGAFPELSRSSYDRVLPELATWLRPDELQRISEAYLTHAGYAQAATDASVPLDLRKVALRRMVAQHASARELLRSRVFTAREQARLATARSDPTGDQPGVSGPRR